MRALLLVAATLLAFGACSEQKPTDPAPAPVAEAPAEPALAPETAAIPATDVATKLSGKWQAIDDANSILTITADSWTNEYTGDASVHDVAKWRAFPGTETPPNSDGIVFTPASTYIEVISGENTFFYEIGAIQADAFDMFYVSRGSRLAYKRIT